MQRRLFARSRSDLLDQVEMGPLAVLTQKLPKGLAQIADPGTVEFEEVAEGVALLTISDTKKLHRIRSDGFENGLFRVSLVEWLRCGEVAHRHLNVREACGRTCGFGGTCG